MYLLMNKDNLVATFDFATVLDMSTVVDLKVIGKLPYGCSKDLFAEWLGSRFAAKHRSHLEDYLLNMQAATTQGFIDVTHSISINDTYWVKKDTENLRRSDVSPFMNDFDEVVQNLAFDGRGLYGEKLSSTSPEFGTAGAYEKCWRREDDIFLYKRGTEGFF